LAGKYVHVGNKLRLVQFSIHLNCSIKLASCTVMYDWP